MSHPKPSEKRKGLGAGIIAFGVVFALFSLLFRPHTVGAFALATALSLFAGAVIRVMAQGLDVSPTVKAPESLQKVQGNTGDPDVDALLEKLDGLPQPPHISNATAILSNREHHLARLLAADLTYAEAAARLGMSVGSVKNMASVIYAKLHIGSKSKLKDYAL